jgi:hypothetical protein
LPFIEKGEKMEITITLSDEIGVFLQKLPNTNAFVSELISQGGF